MILPRGHRPHVGERLLFEIGARCAGLAARLPLDHPLEALLERLEAPFLVDAVVAVRSRLDRHPAALAVRFVAHRFSFFPCFPWSCLVAFSSAARTSAPMPPIKPLCSAGVRRAIARVSSPSSRTRFSFFMTSWAASV